ncbi:MAG: UDP-N-acetylmuramate dehydrogenase [Calditrichia bacterium]
MSSINSMIKKMTKSFRLIIKENEPLKHHTTYKIGGPAEYLIIPEDRESLIGCLQELRRNRLPHMILGKGSNVLFSDKGIDGFVVSLEKSANEIIKKGDRLVYAGAGVLLEDVVTYTENEGIAGFDYLAGIPGTLGGALVMNAGAFVGEIGERVRWVEVIDQHGNLEIIYHDEIGFGYRLAPGLEGTVILGALLEGEPGSPEELAKKRQEYISRRNAKQPLEFGSCGSVFKRPPGNYAGTLIEKAGCKGLKIGDAMVSPKHANFIVNLGNATANDVYRLIKEVRKRVFQQFGIELELEVKLIGEFEPLPQLVKEKTS